MDCIRWCILFNGLSVFVIVESGCHLCKFCAISMPLGSVFSMFVYKDLGGGV